ncbi:MAG: hypothetical protein KKH98_10115 [Spirochaetes bacterium]|nr:hypothetical protein [Spirochaetota bacterium]
MKKRGAVILILIFSLLSIQVSYAAKETLKQKITKADQAFDKWTYKRAVMYYKEILDVEKNNYYATCRISEAYLNLGFLLHEDKEDAKEKNYALAVKYAKQAIKIDPNKAEAHVRLASSVGRLAMFKGGRDKVEMSKQVKTEAELAVKLDPKNNIAYHILGAWHREVATLGGLLKMFAKILYGGLPDASVEKSETYFKKAIALKPSNIETHIELGKTYEELDKEDLAAKEYKKAISLPEEQGYDAKLKKEAKELLEDL